MAWSYVGEANGYALFRDGSTNDCYQYILEDDEFVYYGNCPGMNIGGSQFPSNVNVSGQVGQVGIQTQPVWWQSILNTLTSLAAIGQGAPYVPTSVQPASGGGVYPRGGGIGAPSAIPVTERPISGANIGDRLEKFVTDNIGIIAIGGIAFALFKSGRK